MKIKKLLKKVSAVLMSAAVLCTGAATVLPQVAESGIEAQAAGNSFASAAQINVNQSYTDSISRKNEVDYYRFTLNSDSKISVSCLHDYVDKNYPFLCLTIYRDNNSIDRMYYTYFYFNVRSSQTINLGLPKGTYFIEFEAANWNSMDYTFKVNASSTSSWEKEFNNSYNSANSISLNKNYNGVMQDRNDEDYYCFTLNNDSKVNVSCSHDYVDKNYPYLCMTIYRDNNSIDEVYYTYFYFNVKSSQTINLGLPKGKYYLKFESANWNSMDYSFIVNATAASNWETEKNDNYNTADVISINKNYNGLLQNSNDDDCYRFNGLAPHMLALFPSFCTKLA